MDKVLRTIGSVVIVIVSISLGSLAVQKLSGTDSSNYTQTYQSKVTTGRNSFISGCTENGDASESFCGCAFDKLLDMHPDLVTNEAIVQRVLADGYNRAETDAMSSCLDTNEV